VEASGTLRASRAADYFPDVHLTYTWMGSRVEDGVVSSSQTAGGLDTIDGNRLPYAPEHTVVVGLSRDFDFGLSLGANAKYVSWVYTDYENLKQTKNRGDIGPIDGYVVYDASASYTRGRYTIFANGKNLFDNVYISSRMHSSPYITAANAQGILIGPRRQINAGASVSF
jgi:Fe(3+) dicitrate transport protein